MLRDVVFKVYTFSKPLTCSVQRHSNLVEDVGYESLLAIAGFAFGNLSGLRRSVLQLELSSQSELVVE